MRLFRILIAASLVLAAGLFIVNRTFDSNDQNNIEQLSTFEMQAKQQLIDQDVQLTDQLCRKQCALQFHQALTEIKSGQDAATVLEHVRKEHPNMSYLTYKKDSQTETAGNLENNVQEKAAPFIKKAEQSLIKNRVYQSETFKAGEQSYFVLAQKMADSQGEHHMIGVVEHQLLDEVNIQQKRNFRVVQYPNEKRWRMETIDAETKKHIRPETGEQQEGASHFQVDEVVVKFNFKPTKDQIDKIREDIHASMPEKQLNNTFIFRSEQMNADEMVDYFKKMDISYVEPHYLYLTNQYGNTPDSTNPSTPSGQNNTPNDELFVQYQWNLPMTDTIKGWNLSRGSENVIVAVIDTGVDTSHSDLQGQLTQGLNIINGGDNPSDDVGHGTHVAGVIAALVNNTEGVAGMSWYNKVMPVKVLDQSGAGTTYSVAQGIIWAVDQGAKVINLSLGNYADAQFLHDAIQYAHEKDVVIVAATGNDNTSQPGFPAAYPEVLAVSAIDSSASKASFSNYGDYVDVVAPGVNIASTYTGNRYAALSGTSMASPHVAALAAMIRSANPNLSNDEVVQIIRETATDLGTQGKDPYYGYGMINVVAALQRATGNESNPPMQATKSEDISWFDKLQLRLKELFDRI